MSFTRNVIPFNFTYAFSKNRFSFGITPLRISINQAKIDPDFLSTLDNSGQFYTSQLLTNNIIAGRRRPFIGIIRLAKADHIGRLSQMLSSCQEI